jgi:hypothetical protein
MFADHAAGTLRSAIGRNNAPQHCWDILASAEGLVGAPRPRVEAAGGCFPLLLGGAPGELVGDGSGRLGHQGAQAELAHELGQADASAAGFLLQCFEVFFGETHQHLSGQLSLFAVAHFSSSSSTSAGVKITSS